jgi:hypothetical protein
MRTGLDEQNAALDSHEKRHAAFLHLARLTARAVATAHGQVSANDIRQRMPENCERYHMAMGAIFRGRDWELIGYVKAAHKSAHARRIGLYRLRHSDA